MVLRCTDITKHLNTKRNINQIFGDICVADVSCRIVASIAIDPIILCIMSFVMPRVDLVFVPFDIELTLRRGPSTTSDISF